MFYTNYLAETMEPAWYDYEQENAIRHEDYHDEEGEMVDEGDDYPEDDIYGDEFMDDDNPYNEDLGWDGGYED